MQEFLRSGLFKVIIGFVALYLVYAIFSRLFRKPKEDKFIVPVRCRHCGWSGRVGKYDRTCRKCGSSDVA
jgi:predicted Zn-ribbon and HTH transcriptional regulator